MLVHVERLWQKIQEEGILQAIKKAGSVFLNRREIQKKRALLKEIKDPAERFKVIYRENLWSNPESVSGSGSTLKYTVNLRQNLPVLFERYNVTKILDAPCGDFNWMKEVMKGRHDLSYIGGDIVAELVEKNQKTFGQSNIQFQVLDITKDPLPTADLMIVRDCLFHLSLSQVFDFFENFKRSEIRMLLTTTHLVSGKGVNEDIPSGDFRYINLFEEPFSVPNAPLMRIDDYLAPDPKRQMVLLTAEMLKIRN